MSKSKSKSKSKFDEERNYLKPHTKKEISAKFNKLGNTSKSFIYNSNLSSKDREYLIHNNGGRPFKVVANNKGIHVSTYKDDHNRELEQNQNIYKVHSLTIKKFIGYWDGFDTSAYTNFHGNSILIQETKHSYVSIGWMIHRFQTTDEILIMYHL